MKKSIIMGLALATVMTVTPMSAYADTGITQDSTSKAGETEVSYDVTAKYTVTIPAGVTLSDKEEKTATISATDVMLESGQKINVTLDSASHTENGSNTFHAENDKGDSTATYTINGGSVSVGSVVATFKTDDSTDLTFSTASGATYAGKHTETLTFGISVEDATVAVTGVSIKNAPTSAFTVGDTGTLTAEVEPDNATDKTVTWSSTNSDVVSVDETTGAYEAKAAGTATITATAGDKTATCEVTVKQQVTLATAFDNGATLHFDTLFLNAIYGGYLEFKNDNGSFTYTGKGGGFVDNGGTLTRDGDNLVLTVTPMSADNGYYKVTINTATGAYSADISTMGSWAQGYSGGVYGLRGLTINNVDVTSQINK